MSHSRDGNCLIFIIGNILLLLWLTAWGGCYLIKKKTAGALGDKPAPVAPIKPAPAEKK